MSDANDDDPLEVAMIPEQHSPVRSMWAEGHGEQYTPLRTFAEAQGHPDGVLIMEADAGGQILVTCPVRKVRAREAVLSQLLCDLEMMTWGPGGLSDSATPYDARIYYEDLPVGSGVGGVMGGGLVIDGVFLAGTRERLEPEERGGPTRGKLTKPAQAMELRS